MKKIEKIRHLLTEKFSPTHIEVIDESISHQDHQGFSDDGSHFAIKISAEVFTGKSLVESHRMVYQALGNMMQTDIHALRIMVVK